LLRQITVDAHSQAERLLTTATHAVESAAKHPDQLNGPGILAVAARLMDSGQLVNYYRASELSQTVVAYYFGTMPGTTLPALTSGSRLESVTNVAVPRPRRQAWISGKSILMCWRRVPLLVLLLGWLALGVAFGITARLARSGGFDWPGASALNVFFGVWGLGFLALVVFQFFATVRRARFRNPPPE
jgi:hypothetical protein